MRKLGILMLAVLVSVGLVATMGGCGGSSGGDSLPQSTPSYAGSNNPAVIDSTTAESFFIVPWDIEMLVSEIGLMNDASLNAVSETSGTLEGDVGGTLSYWERDEETNTPTRYFYKEEGRYTFDSFQDSGATFESIMAAEGTFYYQYKEEETYTGEVIPTAEAAPQAVSPWIDYNELEHQNFSSFYYSDISDEQERSGWMTHRFHVNNDNDVYPWEQSFDANIAFHDIANDFTIGLLDGEADLVWDGSNTTYSGQGTVCIEGNAEYDITGCFDVSFNMMWPEDAEGSPIEDFPSSGTYTASTIDAGVMFTYGTSASNYTCYTVSVDEDGDGEYEIENEFCEGI